ncbi:MULTISPECIES: carbohydrate ABC transporter permease [Eisenbergiella]|uniref:Carbohydrate ABC transporter permease n=1 Tax=Eisenbergiella porci TaxID=2652274 RepID=A0A6N7WCN4_9FIRM|nr:MULTISPECIES: carbohydrate ABC transporter permease [Eisenbergiella]MDY2654205.1 carbohydrate ABC transporter permease [Eisenbergiella porci]MSS88443.1 carbohydrate ABC transporter permease [Eisenbergiella porci]
MKIKSSPARKAFLVVNYFFLTLVMCISLFPLVHVFALSLSSNSAAQAGWVTILPVDFTLDSYQYILAKPEFFQSFGVSVVRVVLGTLLSIGLTILCAYAMAQPDERFHARKYYVWAFLVTMVFSGGLIPLFIVVKSVGIYNSIWALILPGAVQTFNIILMLNFFRGLPYALTESALIDGANHFQIMTKIIVPVSKPSLATVGLFTMVNHWNSWFDGMIYISDTAKYPLQTYLRNVIQSVDIASIDLTSVGAMTNVSQKTVTAAQIFVAIIPILLVYPLLQKYFITGMTLGSVKE